MFPSESKEMGEVNLSVEEWIQRYCEGRISEKRLGRILEVEFWMTELDVQMLLKSLAD